MTKMKTITCPECEGDGVVWILDWLTYEGDVWDHEEVCPECNGEGEIEVEDEDWYEDEEEE
jgi:DnaJ-class molecular chaperone